MGANAGQIKLRMNWTSPIAISPHDHNAVYVGSQFVHKTTDGGQTWTAISPDLTTNDPMMMGDSGGLTVDNLSVEYAGVVYSIAESPNEKGVIWAGTNDGQVQVTRDGGAHWENVTRGLPGLPPRGTVASVDPSHFDGGHLLRRRRPPPGRQPRSLPLQDGGLRQDLEGDRLEHPEEPALLRARRARGPVPQGAPLRGDGKRALRLLRRRRALGAAAGEAPARAGLLADGPGAFPRPGRRHVRARLLHPRRRDAARADRPTPCAASARTSSSRGRPTASARSRARTSRPSAPRTARILPTARRSTTGSRSRRPSRRPRRRATRRARPAKGPVEITITDAAGETIRTLTGSNKPGINRAVWDLAYEPTMEVRLRTTPSGNPHVWEEKRFRGKDRRDVYYYGITELKNGPLVAPGTLHRPALGRREAGGNADPHREQGSQFGRHRRRHRGGDQDFASRSRATPAPRP